MTKELLNLIRVVDLLKGLRAFADEKYSCPGLSLLLEDCLMLRFRCRGGTRPRT